MRHAFRWSFLFFAISLSAGAAEPSSEKSELKAEPALPLCLKTDTVKWWEDAYCQTKTNVDDHAAPDFKKCQRKLKKNKSLPRPTCQKIRWLKARTCAHWKAPGKQDEFMDCLRGKGFPKKADENYEYYFGG